MSLNEIKNQINSIKIKSDLINLNKLNSELNLIDEQLEIVNLLIFVEDLSEFYQKTEKTESFEIISTKCLKIKEFDDLLIKNFEIEIVNNKIIKMPLKSENKLFCEFQSEIYETLKNHENTKLPFLNSFYEINNQRNELIKQINAQFDFYVSKNDEIKIINCFVLYKQINHTQIGIEKLTSYTSSLINTKFNSYKLDIKTSDLLIQIYNTVAIMLDKQLPLIEKYGVGFILIVLKKLQKQCDLQSSIVIDSFLEKNSIARMVLIILFNSFMI